MPPVAVFCQGLSSGSITVDHVVLCLPHSSWVLVGLHLIMLCYAPPHSSWVLVVLQLILLCYAPPPQQLGSSSITVDHVVLCPQQLGSGSITVGHVVLCPQWLCSGGITVVIMLFYAPSGYLVRVRFKYKLTPNYVPQGTCLHLFQHPIKRGCKTLFE